jgi:arsenite methyltransferase
MPVGQRDRWAEWLLERRFGGDADVMERMQRELEPVRDRVLDGARMREGDVVLDVGAGDGLIAFGALERVGPGGRVVFSDISPDLLDRSRELADELGVAARCGFVLASASDLEPIADESVDVVTTRSVLIYLPFEEKREAFATFFRVLRPGGRVSVFEPINVFGRWDPEDGSEFMGLDTRGVADLALKVKAAFEGSRAGDRTLVDFDERDLLRFAEEAGFSGVELAYEARIAHGAAMTWVDDGPPWETLLRTSGNPLAPTFGEVIDGALDADERARFVGQVRPRYEAREATTRSAVAYLTAVKA